MPEERGRSSTCQALLSEASWELRIPKRAVLLSELDKVHRRLTQSATIYRDCAALVPYAEVVVSPMYVTIRADQALAAAQLGPRERYSPLPDGLSEADARYFLRQIVEVLLQLHSCGVVHGHCDAGSFLVRQSPAAQRVVLIDHAVPVSFLARQSAHGQRARRCAAPELLRSSGESFAFSADVWSVGVLLLRLVLPAQKDFTTEDVEDTDLLSPFVSSLTGVARSLLVLCLKGDPASRPTLWELAQHPFLNTTAEASRASEATFGGSQDASSNSDTDREDETSADGGEQTTDARSSSTNTEGDEE